MNADKECHGFSLLEVMIALVILTVGLLAVVALFETGMKALQIGNKRTLAIELARNKMESLRILNVNVLSDGQDQPEGMTRRWSIQKSKKDLRIWIIQVDVVWENSLKQAQIISLKSFAFNMGPIR